MNATNKIETAPEHNFSSYFLSENEKYALNIGTEITPLKKIK